MIWQRYLNGVTGFLSSDATQQMTNALRLASLLALCSFVIASVTLIAYQLDLVDVLPPLATGPPENRIVSLSVMLLAICVVLTVQRTSRFVDGICAVVLLGALARLAFQDKALRWLQTLAPNSAQSEATVFLQARRFACCCSLHLFFFASHAMRSYRRCYVFSPMVHLPWHSSDIC